MREDRDADEETQLEFPKRYLSLLSLAFYRLVDYNEDIQWAMLVALKSVNVCQTTTSVTYANSVGSPPTSLE